MVLLSGRDEAMGTGACPGKVSPGTEVADIGIASILIHSQSSLDIIRSWGWRLCHGIRTTKSLSISSGAVVPSDSVNSACQIIFSTSSNCSSFLLPRAIDICDAPSGKTNTCKYENLPLIKFSGLKLFSILPWALRDTEVIEPMQSEEGFEGLPNLQWKNHSCSRNPYLLG